MRKWTVMVVSGVLTVGAAGCGGGSEPMGGGSPSATTTAQFVTSPQPYGQVIGGRVIVNIRDLKYQPEELKIPTGTTVIFTNNDQVPHSVSKGAGPGDMFNSGPVEPGATYQQIFDKAGTFQIKDELSPETKLKLTVREGK
jgi:plastocyanin